MLPESLELLRPSALLGQAFYEYWPSMLVALLPALRLAPLLASRGSRSVRARESTLAAWLPVADTWAVYLWAMIASLRTSGIFDCYLMAGPSRPVLTPWADAFSSALALAVVLALAALASFVGSALATIRRPSSLGPIAAVAAVGTDWMFALLLVTPFGR